MSAQRCGKIMAGKEAKNAKVKNELGGRKRGYIDLAPTPTRTKMNGIGGCEFILFVICTQKMFPGKRETIRYICFQIRTRPGRCCFKFKVRNSYSE